MIVPPNQESLERAREIIQRGGLVAFPTETVYGLGANALDADAVQRIYQVKRRPFASPLIVHVADEAMARSLATEWPEAAERIAKRYWPGPLTLILRKVEFVPDIVTAGLDSVGIRMPAHPVALSFLRSVGLPIAAPSANLFMQISPTTAQHVQQAFGESIDLIIDGGASEVGIESTVVSLARTPPVVLRPGMISQAELESVTGLDWEREVDRPHLTEAAESPGLHPRHYAPQTPFYLLAAGVSPRAGRGRIIKMPTQSREYASRLYAELHQADKEGWDWIAIEKPPETDEWAGILDRLKRASAAIPE